MKKIVLLLKILVTGTLIALVLSRIDAQRALGVLSSARAPLLAWALALIWAGHLLCIVRWKALLDEVGLRLAYIRLVAIYAIGMFFNLFLPSLVGGDAIKLYLAGRESNGSYGAAFASVFMDRNIGLGALVLISLAALFFIKVEVGGISLAPLVAAMALFYLIANLMFLSRWFYRAMGRLPLLSRLVGKIAAASDGLIKLGRSARLLWFSFGLSLINQLLGIAASWLIARSLGVTLSFGYFLAVVPVIILISMVPISINGVGLREASYYAMFASLGVPGEKSALLGFLTSVLIFISDLPGALLYILFKRRGDLPREMESAQLARRSR